MCLCMHVHMCTCRGLPQWLCIFIYWDRVFRWIHYLLTSDSQFALGSLAQPSKHQDYRQQSLLPTYVDGSGNPMPVLMLVPKPAPSPVLQSEHAAQQARL